MNAILGREPLRAPARYGVLLSELMDAMYESASLHATIKVIPVPQDIDCCPITLAATALGPGQQVRSAPA